MAIAMKIFGPKHPNCVDLKFWAKSIPISSNVHVAKSLKKVKTKAEAKGGTNPASKTVARQPKAKAGGTNPASKIVALLIKARDKAKVVAATTQVATKTVTTAGVVKTEAATTAIAPTMVVNPIHLTAKTAVHKQKVGAPILPATPFQKRKRKNANANAKRLLLARKAKAVVVRANKVKARTREETTVVAVVAKANAHKAAVATTITTIADHSNALINKAVVEEIALHLRKTTAKYPNAR